MIDGHNFRLIFASNALWCTHVSPIYWTFFHLKLQRFTFSSILWIIYCCHLVLFYLWYEHMLGFCNLFCNTMYEVWIGWTITNCCKPSSNSYKQCVMVCPCVHHLLDILPLEVARFHSYWHNADCLLLPLSVVLFVAPSHIKVL